MTLDTRSLPDASCSKKIYDLDESKVSFTEVIGNYECLITNATDHGWPSYFWPESVRYKGEVFSDPQPAPVNLIEYTSASGEVLSVFNNYWASDIWTLNEALVTEDDDRFMTNTRAVDQNWIPGRYPCRIKLRDELYEFHREEDSMGEYEEGSMVRAIYRHETTRQELWIEYI